MRNLLLAVVAVFLATGCAHGKKKCGDCGDHDKKQKCCMMGHGEMKHGEMKHGMMGMMGGAAVAKASVAGLGKSKVKGEVRVEQKGPDVLVSAVISGLKANSQHGFHIHEFGSCQGDGTSAGGHFNPSNSPHGSPQDAARHHGDLGNLVADAKGQATLEITLTNMRVMSVMGRSVIVHADADDLKTQPTGAAGARIACGILGLTQ